METTFADIVDRYIQRQRVYTKPQTQYLSQCVANKFLAPWGKRPVSSLTQQDLDDYVAQRTQVVKPVTVKTT